MTRSDGVPDDASALRGHALARVAARAFAAARADLARLAAQLGDDAVVQLALAEATWGSGDVAAALPHFARAVALDPAGLRARARFGLALQAAGRATEALAELEAVVAMLPVGAPLEAMAAPFAAPLAFEPAPADAAFQLGQVLLAVGELDGAIAALGDAAARDPTRTAPWLVLGEALQTRGELGAASAAYRAAVGLEPDAPAGWRALAQALRQLGQIDEAETCALAALSLDQGSQDRDVILGNALLVAGAAEAARDRLGRAMAGASWAAAAPPRAEPRPRVGVIAAPGRANTPLDFILDRERLAVEIVLMLDGFAYPYERIAACYDVLFNAVADPDLSAAASALALEFAARVGVPIVNHPRLILDTGRERIAARLAGIPGCVVPVTGRYARSELRAPGGAERAAHAIGLPLLARPAGSHGGAHLERLDDAAALAAYLEWAEADALYLTRYHDFRSPDGRYRKYRFIHVDGALLPYHLAIGDDWLVHYVRTAMAEHPALRAEEARFLADPFGEVGPTAAAALHEIATRVGLDYCGIDCAVLPDGRLLLFECNAAMLVRHADASGLFDYKRAPAEAVRDAVSRMLERRAAARE
jgi:tetratricopeptide (TPR) repeat protein